MAALPRSESKSQLDWEITSRDGPTSDSIDVADDAREVESPPRGKNAGVCVSWNASEEEAWCVRDCNCNCMELEDEEKPFASTALVVLLPWLAAGDSKRIGRSGMALDNFVILN